MMYSCFLPTQGLYAYYEGEGDVPLNADLPVPKLPPAVGGIGVPSIEAGRPLPPGARFVGTGWHAKGMVARANGGGLGQMPALGQAAVGFLMAGLVAGAVYWISRRRQA